MVTFCLVVAPLPYKIRKRLFHFLSESPIVGKVAYALKISFIFVAILFIDALQRMFRITAEAEMSKSGGQAVQNVQTETNIAARKFYAQRNTYLTGFCLFLSLILTRTFYIILDLIHTQEEYAKLKQATASQSKSNISSDEKDKQIAELKKKLAANDASARDFDTLKKQAAQNAQQYDELAEKYNKATGQVSNKRTD
ncbi:hypothetical protein SISNIDRAFT_458843, partial [Sistotremastrum niveocremeum HHB9708]